MAYCKYAARIVSVKRPLITFRIGLDADGQLATERRIHRNNDLNNLDISYNDENNTTFTYNIRNKRLTRKYLFLYQEKFIR